MDMEPSGLKREDKKVFRYSNRNSKDNVLRNRDNDGEKSSNGKLLLLTIDFGSILTLGLF